MTLGIAEQLEAAAQTGHLMRYCVRSEPGRSCGYIRAVGAEFVLTSLISEGIWFDGFRCHLVDDIEAVGPDPRAAFLDAVLKARNETAPVWPAVDLDSIEGLLTSASALFPLVTIHTDPDVCHIGRVLSIEGGIVWMLEIDANAVWDTDPGAHRLIEITRVDFDGDYENALYLVGGDPPQPVEQLAVPLRLVTSED